MLLAAVIGGYTLIGGLGATFYVSYFNTALIFVLILMLVIEVNNELKIFIKDLNSKYFRCSIIHSTTQRTHLVTPSLSMTLSLVGRLLMKTWETKVDLTSPSSAQVA